jgi:phosphoribosylaminoimidazole carboxylase (NCAIR synthetase)
VPVTSQFENHLRAVLDLPLGDPSSSPDLDRHGQRLGGKIDDLPSALLHCFARDQRLRVQLYGKQVRPVARWAMSPPSEMILLRHGSGRGMLRRT